MLFTQKAAAAGLSVLVLAAASFSNVKADEQPVNSWTAQDFVIQGNTVYGFSQTGADKLKRNRSVTLPETDETGKEITKVGSFAFVNNKRTAIAEYTSREGENGVTSNLDPDGNEILDIGEEFNAGLIQSVTIPEGYTYIGSDAFTENRNLSSIQLPDSLETIGEYAFAHTSIHSADFPDGLKSIQDQAFFDNQISGTLSLPESLEHLGERAFKSNRISNITFRGSKLKTIPEECFQDNLLTNLTIPLSIEQIEEGAFSGNPGDENYGSIVVLWTPDKTNPHNLADRGVYINPDDEKKTTALDLDYSKWENSDFKIDGNIVTGFSELGKIKVRKNKTLEIPADNNGIPVTEIAADAFRNVDFQNSSLRKYDIEKVLLPDTIEKIGAFAFQSNNLSEFTAGDNLQEIGPGAFMNNRIDTLVLNDSLKIIDDAAFHLNHIYAIIIPENVEKIGSSAFRMNAASHLVILSDKLTAIEEMAFLSNSLEEVDLSHCGNLTEIGVQAFADNRIHTLTLPDKLKFIREEAFYNNQIKEVSLSSSASYIGFNAFDKNPGTETTNGKVEITVADGNPNDVPDGTNFIVNIHQTADGKEDLQALVSKLEFFDRSELRDSTAELFLDLLNQGKALLNKTDLKKGEKLKLIHDARFFFSRSSLDKAIRKAELAINSPGAPENKKLLQRKYDTAVQSFNNAALSDSSVKRLEKELHFLTDLVENKGEISNALMVQGHHELETPLPIPSYHIGVNVYFNQAGTILYVLDMSETIGEGQKDEYGNDILNVDEDNAGYHMLALETLDDYEGLNITEILKNDVDSIDAIRSIEKAPYHRAGFYEAVKDAAGDAAEMISRKTGSGTSDPNQTDSDSGTSGKTAVPQTKTQTKTAVRKTDAPPLTGDSANSSLLLTACAGTAVLSLCLIMGYKTRRKKRASVRSDR